MREEGREDGGRLPRQSSYMSLYSVETSRNKYDVTVSWCVRFGLAVVSRSRKATAAIAARVMLTAESDMQHQYLHDFH